MATGGMLVNMDVLKLVHNDFKNRYNPVDKTNAMTKAVGKDATGKLWTEPVSGNEVSTVTTAWLNEHVAQETGYVIDDSLTTENAAADAKATGDAIAEVAEAVENIRFYISDHALYITKNAVV